MKKRYRQWIGVRAEKKASQFLRRQGLRLLQRNYRCRCGEIDLIMQDQQDLVFVEVRYRHADAHGGALASVDIHKQQRIIRTAQYYCQHQAHAFTWIEAMRFDVFAMQHGQSPQWVQAAFTL